MRRVVEAGEGGGEDGEREESGGNRAWAFPTLGECWVIEGGFLCRLKSTRAGRQNIPWTCVLFPEE